MVGLAFAVGATVGGVVVVAVPPMVIGLPLTVPVCCWLTATAATAPMATKPLPITTAASNLIRCCLIDSIATLSKRPSPLPEASAFPLNMLIQWLYAYIAETTLRAQRRHQADGK